MKTFLYLIFVFITIFNSGFAEASEQIYYPHPIIFIHGLNGSISDWNYVKEELEKYFKDQGEYKYPFQDTQVDYFPYCDYSWQNKGDIPSIAVTALRGAIESAFKSFPSQIPEDERKVIKVIIVAHSMGGLVVRSLLNQIPDYQNKIDRVVFIGTPHLGSPFADSVWILNKIRQDIVNPAVSDYSVFYSQNVGTRFKFSDTSSSLAIIGLPSEVNNYLLAGLRGEQANLNNALRYADGEGFSGSTAIEQLRLNQDVNFHKTIVTAIGVQKSSVELNGSTVGSETFIGRASENLANPGNFKVIRGVNPSPILARTGDLLFTHIYSLYNEYFSFPPSLSFDDTIDTGDGIVPRASQEGIGSADFQLSAFHCTVPSSTFPLMKGETDVEKAPQAILLALDDPPEIVSVRAVPVDWGKDVAKYDYTSKKYYWNKNEQYVIFKIKDYLLADIEIEEITLGAEPIVLPEIFKGTDNKYKPYNAFKKEFLKSRDDTIAEYRDLNGKLVPLKLEPGEFWIKLDLANKNTISIKIKNPAAQFNPDKFSAEKILTLTCPTIKCPNVLWDMDLYRFFVSPAGSWQIGFWQPVYWYPFTPPPSIPANVLDIPPFDSHYSEQVTCSFEVANSLFLDIRVSVFTYLNDEELKDGNIIKRVLTGRNETLNSTGSTEEGWPVYGKSFDNIASWNGSDDKGGYSYTSRIAWRTGSYAPDDYVCGYIKSILVIEPIDDVPEDDLLPLTVGYPNICSFFLEK